MSVDLPYTSERVSPDLYQNDPVDFLIYLLHLKTYEFCTTQVKNKNVLELGCGTGYGAKMLSAYAQSITAVDISRDAIEEAKKHYPSSNIHHELVQPIEKQKLPFSQNTFDIVLSLQVIEHIKDVRIYLNEIKRVLKPCGRLIISTPNAQMRLLPLQRPWNRFHIKEYSHEELTKILAQEFSCINILGLKATSAWSKKELSRCNRNKWLLWPLTNLLIPDPLRFALLSFIWNITRTRRKEVKRKNNVDFPRIDDIFIDEGTISESLKFVAICDKT